jgi:hypothetical protein
VDPVLAFGVCHSLQVSTRLSFLDPEGPSGALPVPTWVVSVPPEVRLCGKQQKVMEYRQIASTAQLFVTKSSFDVAVVMT